MVRTKTETPLNATTRLFPALLMMLRRVTIRGAQPPPRGSLSEFSSQRRSERPRAFLEVSAGALWGPPEVNVNPQWAFQHAKDPPD